MKKRISILTTVALFVTMGTVYATWTYAQEEANSLMDVAIGTTLESEDCVAKGDIKLTSNDLVLTVDKKDDSYFATLKWAGSIEVSFTPNELSSDTEIALQFTISGTNLDYNGVDIFKLPTEAKLLGTGSSWTIDGEDLGITMGAIELPTYADYLDFKDDFEKVSLTITFTEATGVVG